MASISVLYKDGVDVFNSFSKLAQKRVLFLDQDVSDVSSSSLVGDLMYLDSLSNKPITLYIKSYGGSVYDGYAIYDTIRLIKSPVHTIVLGYACSMAAIIFLAGTTRSISKLSKVMLHQPSGGFEGTASAFSIYTTQINIDKQILYDIIKERTLIENPNEALLFDTWYNAEKCIEYGIATKIL